MPKDLPGKDGAARGRLSRRLVISRGSAVVGLGAAIAAAVPGEAQAQRATDNDPNDAAGRGRGGRGTTDNDPRDSAGAGRGSSRGTTDRDPNDGPGAGRGGRGATDNDPRDAAGRGRGVTDSDPSDGPGRGRGR